ncbi:hypothetical protein NCY64_04495 [Phocaeicola vulgatus]|jgi:hypothetical protein|uniref:Uncharacterized protein n=1 Tax=Bacteroides phage F2 TaxID=2762303 RepID=A0A7G9W3G3_9CAUD|nr:hypothetical protein [Phocaeicola vulgatus]QMS42067.1 hypothetical protein Bacuni_F1_00050 [Bacteroides phage Bacuni_F1]QNO13176.1 hypothetical protein BacuniF2_00005 [Bacteroides phage F2]MCM1723540.1 hypothetical protein [Phocaeicola vulgatus]MCM1736946.1 hypothetical protein [Phocaeicola vulgatus]MCM1763627.1 hypothetical protein [Phocaeicola vulgatus]
MARYIKANPKVAQFLRVENDRNQVSDGNYLLWQADMLAFGTLVDLPLILQQIGGISLMAHEARQEQDGTVLRELPTATDPRFVVEKDETPAEDEANNTEVAEEPAEQPTEGAAESEESSEATEEPAEPAGDETAAAESETPNTETV